MKCETCTYNEYCADVGAQKEDCPHYTPAIEVDNAAE